MNTSLCIFLRLPQHVLDRVLGYLDGVDVKNLSSASYGLLSAIENVQAWAPRLHVIATISANQYKEAMRMILEAYPDSYLTCHPTRLDLEQQIVSLDCSPSCPLTYDKAQTTDWRCGLRFRSKAEELSVRRRLWLCPHRCCALKDIVDLLKQQPNPLPSIYSTIAVPCPFPKCSLWTRHALVSTHTNPCMFETCSTIRLYRRLCSRHREIQSLLRSGEFRRRIRDSCTVLFAPVCSHLSICSDEVSGMLTTCNLEDTLLSGAQSHVRSSQALRLQIAFDQGHCLECESLGTYTTWGFMARYTPDAGCYWLDIEMMLCRSVLNYEDWGISHAQHWTMHSFYDDDTFFRVDWHHWTELVAYDGFDRRAQLPPEFLKPPRRGLLDFLTRTPGCKIEGSSTLRTARLSSSLKLINELISEELNLS